MNNQITDHDSAKYWHNQQGQLHREDGPAVEYANGNKYWYQHGKKHREDGPAVEDANGNKCWYQHGQSHREDGLAYESYSGYKEWWINNTRLNVSSQEEFIRYLKLRPFW